MRVKFLRFLCSLLLFITSCSQGLLYASQTITHEEFVWGETYSLPKFSEEEQSAIVGSLDDLRYLSTEAIELNSDDEEDEFGILNVRAPSSSEHFPQTIVRDNEKVYFDLIQGRVIEPAVNSSKDAWKNCEVLESPFPLNLKNPSHLARGVIFSLFRSTEADGSGKFSGRICIGTAFLVSPRCLMTAGHNVVLKIGQRNLPQLSKCSPYAERVEFWPLMRGFHNAMFMGDQLIDRRDNDPLDNGTNSIGVKRVMVPETWDTQSAQGEYSDIAILQLERPVVKPGTLLPVQSNKVHEDVTVSGYPASANTVPCLIEVCEGKFVDWDSIRNSFKAFYSVSPETKHGHSGSPLLVQPENEKLKGAPCFSGVHVRFDHSKSQGVGTLLNKHYFDLIGKWLMEIENGS